MRIPAWMFFFGLIAYMSMTALCGTLSFLVTREVSFDARMSGIELPSFQIGAQPTATPTNIPPTATNTPPPGVTFTPEPTVTATPESVDPDDPLSAVDDWDGLGRITILLMGIDQRSATNDPGPFRTDTMILTQIDPIRKTVGVLSIPRDLWVDIPGFLPNKITMANFFGDSQELPGGGPGLAMEAVRVNLGEPVDFFIRINFDVFFAITNTVAPNGVEVCPTERIYDDKYPDDAYGTIIVEFPAGCQRLDAERLLQYARTRATQGGDFDRILRQQEVMRGLQKEILSAGGIVNFITQIPTLYTQLAGSYTTDLPLDEILSLAKLAAEVEQDDVTFRSINNLHVDFGTNEDGSQQILIPRQNQIRFVVQEAFNPIDDLSIAELRQRADDEDAEIVVYNNTTIPGLAGQTREWMTGQGVTISAVGNIEPPTEATAITIRDYTGNPWTTRYLADLLGLPEDAIKSGTDGITSADVMVVVGSDIQQLLAGE